MSWSLFNYEIKKRPVNTDSRLITVEDTKYWELGHFWETAQTCTETDWRQPAVLLMLHLILLHEWSSHPAFAWKWTIITVLPLLTYCAQKTHLVIQVTNYYNGPRCHHITLQYMHLQHTQLATGAKSVVTISKILSLLQCTWLPEEVLLRTTTTTASI